MDTFLNGIDTERVGRLLDETSVNVKYFNDSCSEVVKQYTEALDDLMKEIYVRCVKGGDATLKDLEDYYLELSNLVYFMNEKVEQLGVYADMSGSASKEVYSKSYIACGSIKDANGKSKSTVAELQAQANLDSQYESVVASIYDHAYRIVKNKVSSAQDMMNCLRKLITSRNTEMQMSSFLPKGEQ